MASSSRLKPGEEGKIVATIDLKGKMGFVTKTVKVFTNDTKRPVTNLVLKVLIKVQPATSPQPTSSSQPVSPPQPASP